MKVETGHPILSTESSSTLCPLLSIPFSISVFSGTFVFLSVCLLGFLLVRL